MKKITFAIITGFVLTALCSAQTGDVTRAIFIQEGIASWYGAEFNGKPTASGEIFNDSALTAAHPSLPFGTVLRVTNQHNNKSVTVRVNDRGPFVAARIIDISRAAAVQLDMITTGTAPVKVESLSELIFSVKPAQTAKPSQTVSPSQTTQVPVTTQVTQAPVTQSVTQQVTQPQVSQVTQAPVTQTVQPQVTQSITVEQADSRTLSAEAYAEKTYRVQVGAFKEIRYAEETYKRLKNAGFNPEYEKYGDFYRVVLSGLKQDDLAFVSERLSRAGFREVVLREEI